MSISQFLQQATSWLAWSGLGLGAMTLIAFLFRWGVRFRLVGATIFSLLLSGSCWAFKESYSPPVTIEGAIYAPVVFDNGVDLVVAKAPEDFPEEAIDPSLEQIAENLKGGGRNGSKVTIRIRKLITKEAGISEPIILGEVISDPSRNLLIHVDRNEFINSNTTNSIDTSQLEDQKITTSPQSFELNSSEELNAASFSDITSAIEDGNE